MIARKPPMVHRWQTTAAACALSCLTLSTTARASETWVATYNPHNDPSMTADGGDLSASVAGTAGDGVYFSWIRSTGDTDINAHQWIVRTTDAMGSLSGRTQFGAGLPGSEWVTFDGTQAIALTGHAMTGVDALRIGMSSGRVYTGSFPFEMQRSDTANGHLALAALNPVSAVAAFGPFMYSADLATITGGFTTVPGVSAIAAAVSPATNELLFVVGTQSAVTLYNAAGSTPTTIMVSHPISVAVTPLQLGFAVEVLTATTLDLYALPATSAPPILVASSPTFGATTDVALARDYSTAVTDSAWSVALIGGGATATGQIAVITALDTAVSTIDITRSGGFSHCRRLSAATTGSFPDTLFVSMVCTDGSGSPQSFFGVVQRSVPLRDAGPDAAVDASEQEDVAADTTQSNDVSVETDATDAMNDSEVDASTQPPLGTGPSFRGSGCACRATPGQSESNQRVLAIVAVALASMLAKRRARRG